MSSRSTAVTDGEAAITGRKAGTSVGGTPPTKNIPLPHLLTIGQLAEHLDVTPRHIRRLVAERRIPFLKWRRFIRFDPDEIRDWLDQSRQPVHVDSGPRR